MAFHKQGKTTKYTKTFNRRVIWEILFGLFWEHVLGYWTESLEMPEKVMFLTYEELKMKPCFYLKKIAEFLGCGFSIEEESDSLVDDY